MNTSVSLKKPTQEDISPIKGQITKAYNKGVAIEITNDSERDDVAEQVAIVKQNSKKLKEIKATFTDPIKALQKATKELFGVTEQNLKDYEAELKQKLVDYEMEKEAKFEEEQAKLQQKMKDEDMSPSEVVAAVGEMEESTTTDPVRTKRGVTSFRTAYEATVIDESLVPKEYWVVDTARVKAQSIENHKAGADPVPGVEVKETKIPSVRV